MSTLICPNCKTKAENGELFCSKCGTKLESFPEQKICKSCGAELKPDAFFCSQCGSKFKDEIEQSKSNSLEQDIPQCNPMLFIVVKAVFFILGILVAGYLGRSCANYLWPTQVGS